MTLFGQKTKKQLVLGIEANHLGKLLECCIRYCFEKPLIPRFSFIKVKDLPEQLHTSVGARFSAIKATLSFTGALKIYYAREEYGPPLLFFVTYQAIGPTLANNRIRIREDSARYAGRQALLVALVTVKAYGKKGLDELLEAARLAQERLQKRDPRAALDMRLVTEVVRRAQQCQNLDELRSLISEMPLDVPQIAPESLPSTSAFIDLVGDFEDRLKRNVTT